MVGLVLVAHSRPLASALVDFVRQMADESVPIQVAAGTGDDGADFGTDASAIVDAITSVAETADGVLVLVDVGSGVLSAEMALEFLDDAVRERTRLCPAPFVEGALAAAVQAGLDADLDAVYREAVGAMDRKREHIGDVDAPDAAAHSAEDAGDAGASGESVDAETTLRNPHGLHARPAADFVKTASRFDAEISIEDRTTERGPVSATSITSVIALGAVQDHRVRLSATGPDAEQAIRTLVDLIDAGFGELDNAAEPDPVSDTTSHTPAPSPAAEPDGPDADDGSVRGIAVSTGIALGPAYQHRPAVPDLPDAPPLDPESAWETVQEAMETVRRVLQREQSDASNRGEDDAAGILGAQELLLEDPALRDRVRTAIVDANRPAARAWMDAVSDVAAAYASTGDAYLQQRADDVRDVGRRVVFRILGITASGVDGPDDPFVLVASNLVPSDVTGLDPDRVRGVVCAHGNPTSHSGILLRSRGIPAVFDAGEAVLDVDDGTRIGLDGHDGRVWIDPPESVAADLTERRDRLAKRRASQIADAQTPATTTDGVRIRVDANVNHPADADAALRFGADGVGLLRTEFLFVDADDAPGEHTQVDALEQAATALHGRPVTVRALDVGGDKPLRYVSMPDEANPFLGLRGIRVLLRHEDLFRTQLRAIARVATRHPIRLLLPMIATPAEVRQTRDLLNDVLDALDDDGVPVPDALPVGAMVETPASALGAYRLAQEVDFFSIGTNDLTQYTMASDREHADLTALSDALHPPVLHLLQHVADVGRDADVPVSVCGEIAADLRAVPVLVGLGLRSLSVSPPSIPPVKAAVRALSVGDAETLAADALACDDADAVRRRADAFWADVAPDVLAS